MDEIRLAKKGEAARQKEIWKLCFGDSDNYIDFYYANRYKDDETVLLLHAGKISAMLTMIPTTIVTSDRKSFSSAMLYAIATHPEYRNRGFATQLMEFSSHCLRDNNKDFSILVPAGKHLFDFYRRQGYRDGFYIREVLLTRDRIEGLSTFGSFKGTISSITPEEYNLRRNNQCDGRLYVAYSDEDIAYQQKLSRQSAADIYGIDIGETYGCAVIERLASDKVLLKEVLVPEGLVHVAIQQIAQRFYAKEYILRTPADIGEYLGGSTRPFGMFRVQRETDLEITSGDCGYIGLAFD